MRIFENLNVDFMGKRKFFYVISTVFFLIGVVMHCIRGSEFGIDFNGEITEIVLEFEKPVSLTELVQY